MKKNILTLVAILVFLVQTVTAQEETYTEEPPYFAIGGGYVGEFLFMDVDLANDIVRQFIPGAQFSSPMYMSGPQAMLAIGIIDNLRVGYSALAASQVLTGTPSDTKQREFGLIVKMNGIHVDYAIWRSKIGLTVLPSIVLGWGDISMAAIESERNYVFDPQNPQIPTEKVAIFQSDLWFTKPALQVEYIVTAFTMIRLQASYSLTTLRGDGWRINGVVAQNMPTSLNGSGLGVQFGLFVGLFND